MKTLDADKLADGPRLALDEARVQQLAETLRLLGEPNRLRIALLCLGEPLSVGEIAATVGASLSLVSHHLRLLRAARIVRAVRHGRQVRYALTDDHVRCVLVDMLDHIAETDDGEAEDA